MTRFMKLALVAAVGSALAASPAHAGKPSASAPAPSSIKLDQADPHLGGTVTFTVSYPSTIKTLPRYQVRCSQGGELTYGEARNVGESLLLGGGWSVWLDRGGEADCTADLFWIEWKPNSPQQVHMLATTSFHAAG